MKMKKTKTARGFRLIEFNDHYGSRCSIQKSSLASDDAIWFGVSDPNPQILAVDAYRMGLPGGSPFPNGWVPFNIPKEVSIKDRMHLTRKEVKKLIPILQKFVDTGELP